MAAAPTRNATIGGRSSGGGGAIENVPVDGIDVGSVRAVVDALKFIVFDIEAFVESVNVGCVVIIVVVVHFCFVLLLLLKFCE